MPNSQGKIAFIRRICEIAFFERIYRGKLQIYCIILAFFWRKVEKFLSGCVHFSLRFRVVRSSWCDTLSTTLSPALQPTSERLGAAAAYTTVYAGYKRSIFHCFFCGRTAALAPNGILNVVEIPPVIGSAFCPLFTVNFSIFVPILQFLHSLFAGHFSLLQGHHLALK